MVNNTGNSVSVLHILGSLDQGGTERRLIDALKEFPPGRIETHFLLLSGKEGGLAGEARDCGAHIHVTVLSTLLPFRYWKLLRQINIDVVHSHIQYSSGGFLALAALRRVPRRIAHFRSVTDVRPGRYESLRRRLQRCISKWLLQHYATDIVGVSESVLDSRWPSTTTSGPERHVIFNGIPVTKEDDLSGGLLEITGELLIQVGRICEIKNQIKTVEVFDIVAKAFPTARLELIGKKENLYGVMVESLVDSLSLKNKVIFSGVRNDVRPAVIPRASVLVHPTRIEGLSGVILEAAAAGISIVASDIPPNREVAKYLQGIHLVELDHSSEEWASIIISLLRHPTSKDIRELRQEQFRESPFAMAPYIARMLRLYGVDEN